ncbi:hypothetical protein [Nocardiopsis trehalosi]|uniref:hypothetical protein n=1 Tax=Nocardiopsis trehalosi TaxID=109329 RepID=UPI00083718AA|nr:hypothetical protein [Nocardiopsis trehalosi]
MSDQTVERMPGKVKLALFAVVLQAAANGYGGFRAMAENTARIEHHQETIPALNGLMWVSFVVAAALIACLVFACLRFEVARNAIFFMEGVSILSTVATMFVAGVFSPGGLVLPVVVFFCLINAEASGWFNRTIFGPYGDETAMDEATGE